jgi:hypothetical protein
MIYRLFGEHGYNSKDIEFVRVKQLKNNELRFYKIDMDKLLYSNIVTNALQGGGLIIGNNNNGIRGNNMHILC